MTPLTVAAAVLTVVAGVVAVFRIVVAEQAAGTGTGPGAPFRRPARVVRVDLILTLVLVALAGVLAAVMVTALL